MCCYDSDMTVIRMIIVGSGESAGLGYSGSFNVNEWDTGHFTQL